MSSPAIRFAGFTDDWEERKIQDLADRHDNLRIPITASNRVSGNTPYYGANGIQDYVEGFTHDGEFILVAEDGANDLQDYPVNYVNFKVWVNNHAHVLQAKQFQADNKFLMNALKHTDIEPYLVGGGRAKLNAGTMMEISFPIPTVAEQSRIGKFFFALDDRITLHQRAHDKTVNIKKALLEKMFPKDGEDKPEIRFTGFTDAWEQRKLGDLFNFQYGEGNTNPSNGGQYPVYGAGGQQGFYSKYNAEDSIIIGHMGDAGCVTWGEGKHFVTYNGTITTGKMANFPIRFGFYLLLTSNLRKLTGGSSLKFLTYEMVQQIETLIPSIKEEQEKISAFFTNLDRLITLHKRELTKFQNIKKALLEKMFV